MKKHQKVLLLSVIAITLLSSIIVYAQTQSTPKVVVPTITTAMLDSSSEILTTLDSTDTVSGTKIVYDELAQKNIYQISNEKYTINLDESNNLLGIYSKDITPVLARTAVDKETAKNIILNIYNELNLPSDYELVYLEQFDNEIWEADFAKKYNDVYNKFESVKTFFVPANSEIVSLTVFNEGHDLDQVTVSQEEAIQTATNTLDINSQDIISASLSMEKANNYYNKSSKDTSIHTSWVLETSDNSFVFVDASDNTIIGGDCINE